MGHHGSRSSGAFGLDLLLDFMGFWVCLNIGRFGLSLVRPLLHEARLAILTNVRNAGSDCSIGGVVPRSALGLFC